MAMSGGGNAYYGQTAEDLIDPFSEEFDLLKALVATKVTVSLDGIGDVGFELLNDYPVARGGFRFPDVASHGDVWGMFRAMVPEELCGKGNGELCQILKKATISYIDNEGESHSVDSDALALPSLPPSAWNQIVADETVENRLAELEASRLQREASEAARRGDWHRVDAILREAHLLAENNIWIKETLKTLQRYARMRDQQHFAKESLYQSSKMSTRRVDRMESMDSIQACRDLPSFLRRKGEQGKKDEDR
jgi:Ca-activated chloride channel family protein